MISPCGAAAGRRTGGTGAEGGGTSKEGGGTTTGACAAGARTGCGAAAGGAAGAAAEAEAGATVADSTPTRRSSRSMRVAAPASEAGTSIRATISSRCRRGEVAPTISSSASLTVSAMRDSSAVPKRCAWIASAASWSAGTPRSTLAAASPVAATTMRSRIRSSRSSTKRRGSCPVCTMRSIAAKAPAASPSATAVTTSSIRAALV